MSYKKYISTLVTRRRLPWCYNVFYLFV